MSRKTLSPVNSTPAATWNHLSINHTTIEVPDVLPAAHKHKRANSAVLTCPNDQDAVVDEAGVPAGAGKTAERWLDTHAAKHIVHTVLSGSKDSTINFNHNFLRQTRAFRLYVHRLSLNRMLTCVCISAFTAPRRIFTDV